ncbi:hypothetical protein BDV11DRAFT_202707 [Aspergillus similis]
MRRSVYAWLTLSTMRGAVSPVKPLNLTALYGPGISDTAQILDPSEPGFMDITPRWTQYRPPTYYGAIIPATEADIQHIVRVSVEHDIPFLATGGGHGLSATLGQFSGITIELSKFNTVELDKETSQITLGDDGVGNVPCIGAVGATLGGRLGIGQGVYGLGLDPLLSVRLITATGDIVVASRTENQDQFWAIRAAGASFGIVTSAIFQLYDAVNSGIVAIDMFTYSPEQNQSVWEALKSYDENIHNELSFNIAAIASINAEAEYYRPRAEAERLLQPFLEIGPISVQSTAIPWTQIYDTTFTAFFNELYALWEKEERYYGEWIIARSPTRVMRLVSDEETVFPRRHAITHLLFGNFYSDRPEAWYGSANLKRLNLLKSKWDPDGVFNNYNPVLL